MIKAAAKDPRVERIFVNAAIKKALCREAGSDRGWLGKVQPWWGHDYHFHVRLGCPADDAECTPQPPRPADDGCGKELDHWFTDAILHPKPSPTPPKPRPPLKMADLPARLPAGAAGAVAWMEGSRVVSRDAAIRGRGAPRQDRPALRDGAKTRHRSMRATVLRCFADRKQQSETTR